MAAEIAAKVTRILSTDNTVNYIHSYNPPPGVCKLHYEDGSHSYDKSCLDRIHHNHLFDYLLGKNPQPQIGANVPINSSSDYLVHYLIEVLLITFMVPLIKMAYTRKQTRIPKGFNPFRDRPFAPIPGYRCYYTIMEDESVMTSDTSSQEFVRGKDSDEDYYQNEDSLIVATRERRPHVTEVRGGPTATANSGDPEISHDIAISRPSLLPAPRTRESRVREGKHEGEECMVKEIFDSESMLEREFRLTQKYLPHKIGYYCHKEIPGGIELYLHKALTNLEIHLIVGPVFFNIEEWSICEQIAQGVRELHATRMAHGDLTPENVLIELQPANGPVIMLADFSLSSDPEYLIDLVDYKKRRDDHRLGWYAPEISERASVNLDDYLMADIYMLGSMFSYVLYGSRSEQVNEFMRYANEVENSIMQGRIHKVSRLHYLTIRFKSLIMAMTARDPIERPSISCVAMHPALWSPKRQCEFLDAVNQWLMKSRTKPVQASISKKGKHHNSNHTRRPRNSPVEHVKEDSQKPEPSQESKDSLAMVKSLRPFAQQICRGENWYLHLETWLKKYLEHDPKAKKTVYDPSQPEQLIRLIRNLHHHYTDINEKANFAIEDGNYMVEYFSQFFPYLLPIVYEQMQKFKHLFPGFYCKAEDIKYAEWSITPEAPSPNTQIELARPSGFF